MPSKTPNRELLSLRVTLKVTFKLRVISDRSKTDIKGLHSNKG